MKVILSLSFLLASFAFASSSKPAPLGAFTYKNYLYVTFLADCNTKSATLQVDPLCHKDRATDNVATTCETKLLIAATRMICPDVVVEPKVFVFDLANEPIAAEAKVLKLRYFDSTLKVKINRE
ncbi:MAG: hypothetical protein JNL11_00550 [Bdellovibrionaceae bacterium]|nr:hypothetical protein [Pseudobdellovibrionaceae bacterium]